MVRYVLMLTDKHAKRASQRRVMHKVGKGAITAERCVLRHPCGALPLPQRSRAAADTAAVVDSVARINQERCSGARPAREADAQEIACTSGYFRNIFWECF